jgi:hypothetical protein
LIGNYKELYSSNWLCTDSRPKIIIEKPIKQLNNKTLLGKKEHLLIPDQPLSEIM